MNRPGPFLCSGRSHDAHRTGDLPLIGMSGRCAVEVVASRTHGCAWFWVDVSPVAVLIIPQRMSDGRLGSRHGRALPVRLLSSTGAQQKLPEVTAMGWVWKERQSWCGSYRDEGGKQHTKSFRRQIDAKRWVATLSLIHI